MKFLGVQSHGPHQDIPSEGKDKLLHVVPLSIGKSRTPCVVRVLGRQYTHFRTAAVTHLSNNPKDSPFWLEDRERDDSPMGPGCPETAWPSGLSGPVNPMVINVSATERNAVWSHWLAPQFRLSRF